MPRLIAQGSRISIPGIRGAPPQARLLVDHNGFGVAHITRLISEMMSLLFECSSDIIRNPERLEGNHVRHPLMMEARSIHGLLNIHVIVKYVQNYLKYRINDSRSAGAPDRQNQFLILEDQSWRHSR